MESLTEELDASAHSRPECAPTFGACSSGVGSDVVNNDVHRPGRVVQRQSSGRDAGACRRGIRIGRRYLSALCRRGGKEGKRRVEVGGARGGCGGEEFVAYPDGLAEIGVAVEKKERLDIKAESFV